MTAPPPPQVLLRGTSDAYPWLGPMPYSGQSGVYRAYCACGCLLYVGLTEWLPERLAAHRASSWHRLADRIEWTSHRTRREAADAEAHAIRTEHPTHNVMHNRAPGARCACDRAEDEAHALLAEREVRQQAHIRARDRAAGELLAAARRAYR